MKLITITTDFGNLNGFTGTMKGVIYGITPDVQIVDITHEIPAQDVRTGSIALWRAVPYFPRRHRPHRCDRPRRWHRSPTDRRAIGRPDFS
jgi:S-adenosylmethionine hydrolase